MKVRASPIRWSSASSSAIGIEIDSKTGDRDALADRLTQALAELAIEAPTEVAFAIARIEAGSTEQLADGFEALGRTRCRARVYAAIDASTLAALDRGDVGNDRVGILLDGVSANTPLSVIASTRVEAIRFDVDFIAATSRNLRSSCVLDAMLGLTKDLGICTLADASRASEPQDVLAKRFDFSPSEPRAVVGRFAASRPAREKATPRLSGALIHQ